jgi:hypothetical protein
VTVGDGRFWGWAYVAGGGSDELVRRGLLNDVGAPADRAAQSKGRSKHRARKACALHDDTHIELDVAGKWPTGLEFGEPDQNLRLDCNGEVDEITAKPFGDLAQ